MTRDRGAAEPAWRRALDNAVEEPAELLASLGLGLEVAGDADRVAEAVRQLPLRVPRSLVARMRPGDPTDPLLRQVLPLACEARSVVGFTTDPLGEGGASVCPGLLRKYRGRALLLVTGACAVHCRYCFRRHLRATERSPAGTGFGPALAAIAADPSVEEVILSGGDPLTAADADLTDLARAVAAIPHVRRLRLHTRMPVVVPERVTGALLGWLAGTRLTPLLVVHVNHPAELDADVAVALGQVRAAGVTLLNQSVLLAGVNDRLDTLAELSRSLFAIGVLPYYLHLLDRVQGAAHFEVDEDRARALLRGLAAELPGYLVPRLVRERPGSPAKVAIAP